MPELDDVEIAERKPFYPGLEGTIKSAVIVKTAVQGYSGVRVTLVADSGEEYAEMLWKRGEVGPYSKLGAFIIKLGKNTDTWIGQRIRVVEWKEKRREITVLPQAKPKAKGGN